MFKRLSIPCATCEDPLAWWCNYEGQFSNVVFLAKQILGIPRSQIETKKVFSLARVLITLQRCQLQVINLDKIITIVKNWRNNLCTNFMPNKTMKDYVKVEGSLVNDNFKLIKEVEYFENLNIDVD